MRAVQYPQGQSHAQRSRDALDPQAAPAEVAAVRAAQCRFPAPRQLETFRGPRLLERRAGRGSTVGLSAGSGVNAARHFQMGETALMRILADENRVDFLGQLLADLLDG